MIHTSGDCTITMCADFQDPVEMIPRFVAEWEKGYKIVIGRKTQSKENPVMYWLRGCYYKLIKKMSSCEQIKAMVAEYYHDFKEKKTTYQEGDRITYAARVFDEKKMCALTDATLDFWLTTGRFADQFEKEFAKWIGVKFAHLVNSGSSANLIAFMALTAPELGDRQIRKGDEIITVACGFPTTVTPAIQYGAVPVFVDVTVPQYNIDVTKLEAALSPKTKAVMIAHTLGNPFDLSAVKAFCDAHNLWLVCLLYTSDAADE